MIMTEKTCKSDHKITLALGHSIDAQTYRCIRHFTSQQSKEQPHRHVSVGAISTSLVVVVAGVGVGVAHTGSTLLATLLSALLGHLLVAHHVASLLHELAHGGVLLTIVAAGRN